MNNSCSLWNAAARTLCLLTAALMLVRPAAADPAQPTHTERESIGTTAQTRFGYLSSFDLNGQGHLLCADSRNKQVKVISQVGRLIDTWTLPFAPWRIRYAGDGTTYVGGDGILARLDERGKIIAQVRADGQVFADDRISGIAVSPEHVFVSVGNGWSLGSKSNITRFTRRLTEPRLIGRSLRGCCQRLDLAWHDGKLYVAENARYRVLMLDAGGQVLGSWGQRGRGELDKFGSCCNPMNLYFGPGGQLYTAESGLGRVKRYTPQGKFLGLVGEVGVQRFTRAGRTAASCSNITIAVSPDGKRVFVQDIGKNIIRVLLEKGQPAAGSPAVEPTLAPEPGAGNRPSGSARQKR